MRHLEKNIFVIGIKVIIVSAIFVALIILFPVLISLFSYAQ